MPIFIHALLSSLHSRIQRMLDNKQAGLLTPLFINQERCNNKMLVSSVIPTGRDAERQCSSIFFGTELFKGTPSYVI